jgi:hypothetical protein
MKSQKANGSTGSRNRMSGMVNKVNGGPGDPPSKSSQLPEVEITFNPTPREKVLIAANQAVNTKKVSWRESKGGTFGTLKNKAKAAIGNKDFRADGTCTNNTCVEAVGDYHKKAKVPFSNTSDNRTLKKQLQSGELGYRKTTTPKKGDIVQFEKTKFHKIPGTSIPNPFKKPTPNYPSHIGVVSDINKKGRPTKYIGTSGTSKPNLKRGTHYKLENQKESKVRKPEKKVYYTLNK